MANRLRPARDELGRTAALGHDGSPEPGETVRGRKGVDNSRRRSAGDRTVGACNRGTRDLYSERRKAALAVAVWGDGLGSW